MKLSSFMIAFSVLVLGVIGGGTVLTQRAIYLKSFEQVQKEKRQSAIEFTTTILSAKSYLLRTFAEEAIKRKDLGENILLDSRKSAQTLLQLSTELKLRTGCDYADIFDLEKRSGSALKEKIRDGKITLEITQYQKNLTLLAYAPIKYPSKPVGVVVFGFNLNGAIKKEIEKGTNTTVSFLKDQNNGAVRIALPDHSEQSVFLLLSNLGLSKIADGVQLNSLIAITILILLSSLFGYLLILFGFLKHFKLAAKQFELTAKDLERGVIVPVLPKRYFIHEVTGLFDSFSKVVANLKKFQEQVSLKSRVEAAGEKAAQVAHDLSGPLSALHMALAAEVPKKTVREIVARIEAVVSALSLTLPEDKTLNESQDAHSLSEIETLLIGLSTEKSIQYRSSNITLSLEMMPISVECEVRLNSAEFLRVVSNLLDNAFQAANSGGVVVLSTLTTADRYELRIKDNGCGISSEILSQLGQRGFSHQKRGGSGLGIWHANERINAWGGQLLFDSTLNIGTVVAVSLPVHSSAVKTISLDSSRGIVILDDDPSIHFWWKRKFASLFKQNSPTVIYLSSISEFWHWFSNESHTVQDPVYFFDFDLKDGTWDGLKLIEELQIQNEATLVTGHVDSRLKARCRKLKLRLIHKAQLNALEIIIKQKQFHKDRK